MRKGITVCLECIALAGCAFTNFTAPLSGGYVTATVKPKNFIVVGYISIQSTETHTVGPFGLVRKVNGSKIHYTDFMQEAARLEADDIVDVRIEMNTSGKTGFFGWLRGWERIFTYTGNALAIKYVDKDLEIEKTNDDNFEPEYAEIPGLFNR
jgi:hypothetical protein